jgi:hypothetical protein
VHNCPAPIPPTAATQRTPVHQGQLTTSISMLKASEGAMGGAGQLDAHGLQGADRPQGRRRNPRLSGQHQGREIGRTRPIPSDHLNHPGVCRCTSSPGSALRAT